MDIAALSMVTSQTRVQNQASLMVMKKAMDSSKENGQIMIDLLATSGPRLSPPNLGQSVDISA